MINFELLESKCTIEHIRFILDKFNCDWSIVVFDKCFPVHSFLVKSLTIQKTINEVENGDLCFCVDKKKSDFYIIQPCIYNYQLTDDTCFIYKLNKENPISEAVPFEKLQCFDIKKFDSLLKKYNIEKVTKTIFISPRIQEHFNDNVTKRNLSFVS